LFSFWYFIAVQLFEVIETERNLFLVMEYASGGKQLKLICGRFFLYKIFEAVIHDIVIPRQPCNVDNVPYLTLPPGWTGSYTCPALRPYQFGPMCIPECNHKVTGSSYKAVDGCEAVNRWL